jgi:hypothetical protein
MHRCALPRTWPRTLLAAGLTVVLLGMAASTAAAPRTVLGEVFSTPS